jgi:hypothetical protein
VCFRFDSGDRLDRDFEKLAELTKLRGEEDG